MILTHNVTRLKNKFIKVAYKKLKVWDQLDQKEYPVSKKGLFSIERGECNAGGEYKQHI